MSAQRLIATLYRYSEPASYLEVAVQADGGAIAGGSAAFSIKTGISALGGAVASGAAKFASGVVLSAVGGSVSGGDPTFVSGTLQNTSGGAVFGAQTQFTTGFVLAASGGAVAGGLSVFSAAAGIVSEGGAVAGGKSGQAVTRFSQPIQASLDRSVIHEIKPLSVSSVSATAVLDDIATLITVRFCYDWHAGDYTGSVTYSAPEQIKMFGRIERIIEAPFCPTARAACRIAEYWTRRLAVPSWNVSIDVDRSARLVQTGDKVSLVHPYLPGGRVVASLITSREYNPETGSVVLNMLVAAQLVPEVVLTGYAGKFTQAATSGTSVVVIAGRVELTIADDAGNILSGAVATLDGGISATSDSSGKAVFTNVPPGNHNIEIISKGYAPFVLQVTV